MVEEVRCAWAGTDPRMVAYHDDEWGVPTHRDDELFELLTLEGAQAGLSWKTILDKRDGYRAAFTDFDPAVVAAYTEHDVDRLVADASIVRHRGKITSTVDNARAVLAVQDDVGSLDGYVWSFVDGTPIVNRWRDTSELPATSSVATALSKDLKRRGFRFVGPTTVYAFMQAAGLIDDHVATCFRAAGSPQPAR
jgi:DNA-3-methyladenine glycosylase I